MTRPRCSIFLATSLDGFIARRDGGLDWLDAVQSPGEDYGYAVFLASVDTVLLGRKTWEVARSFEEHPYAGKQILVATTSTAPPPPGVEFVRGDLPAVVRGLSGRAAHVYVDGGITIRTLLAAGHIDTLTLSIIPRLLGDGLPLFAIGLPEQGLRLVGVQTWPTGLAQLRYEVHAPAP